MKYIVCGVTEKNKCRYTFFNILFFQTSFSSSKSVIDVEHEKVGLRAIEIFGDNGT